MQTSTKNIYEVSQQGAIPHLKAVELTTAPLPAASVEISQNSKGQAQCCIKLYGSDPEAAAQQALSLYRRLTQALETGQALAPDQPAAPHERLCPGCGNPAASVAEGHVYCHPCWAARQRLG
jgi:hypothetical protein